MALTQVKTNGIADDAVTLAKQAAGTDGQIITYDASGNPTAVGPGTDGQVLTSTGAGSPPAFETLPTSGAALTGSTNNTITTVTGANAIQGEANLTFDGSTLDCTGNLRVDISSTGTAGSGSAEGIFLRNTNETDGNAVTIFGGADDYSAAASAINFINVDHSANAGAISFDTRTTGNSYAERLRIDSTGRVGVNQTSFATSDTMLSVSETSGHCEVGILSKNDSAALINFGDPDSYNQGRIKYDNSDSSLTFRTAGTDKLSISTGGNVTVSDGDLVIGTSGHGIDFSNAPDAGTGESTTSSLLDDYEEGTWTPTLTNGPTISSESGRYIKIGKIVHVFWAFTTASDGPAGHANMNMPFMNTGTAPQGGGTAWDYRTNTIFAHVSAATSKLYFYDQNGSWMAGSNSGLEGEIYRACTTFEIF